MLLATELEAVISQHDVTLQHIARRAMRRYRIGSIDEAYCEVLWFLPRVLATYNGTLGTLDAHLYRGISWYIHKEVVKQRAHLHAELQDTACNQELSNLELKEEVVYLLSGLPEYERALLAMRHIQDKSYTEIAQQFGVCKGTARLHVRRAEKHARKQWQMRAGALGTPAVAQMGRAR